MRYGSVCSGIEAATAAWHPLGWDAAFFSEIEPFPRACLNHHYPDVPLHSDFTTIGENDYGTIDLLVGGTPCQSFSIAGLRKGMADDRGNLALEFLRLAQRKRPTWLVWENVPGVLSSNGGRDFGAFLGGLGELGYGFAHRVLDAQYFGVAQRRRRVFVVGYLGDWRPPAAVLFERHSLQGHPAPRRETGEESPGFTPGSFGQYRAGCGTLRSEGGDIGPGSEALVMASGQINTFAGNQESSVAATIQTTCDDYSRSDGFNIVTQYGEQMAGTLTASFDSSACADRGQNVVAVHGTQDPDILTEKAHPLGRNSGQENAVALPINTQIATRGEKMGEGTGFGIGEDGEPAFTLQAAHSHAVAFAQNQRDEVRIMDKAGALAAEPGMKQQTYIAQGVSIRGRDGGATAELSGDISTALRASQGGGDKPHVMTEMAVRRLTPIECERLQGFPDNFTQIPWRNKTPENCPDSPRYKALGNSMAVPVMRWIGERIDLVQNILAQNKAAEIVAGMNSHQGDAV